MRRLGAEQEVGIEIDRWIATGSRVQTDGNGGRGRGVEKTIHPQRQRDIRIVRDIDLADGHRLERLFGRLAQHGGGPVADLLPHRGGVGCSSRIALGTDNIM